jgi:hypothetical protein
MGGVSVETSTAGVLLQPYVTGLSGSSYQYGSKTIGGKKSKKSKKYKKSKKSAKKSRKSAKKSRKSKKTCKKMFPMLGF